MRLFLTLRRFRRVHRCWQVPKKNRGAGSQARSGRKFSILANDRFREITGHTQPDSKVEQLTVLKNLS